MAGNHVLSRSIVRTVVKESTYVKSRWKSSVVQKRTTALELHSSVGHCFYFASNCSTFTGAKPSSLSTLTAPNLNSDENQSSDSSEKSDRLQSGQELKGGDGPKNAVAPGVRLRLVRQKQKDDLPPESTVLIDTLRCCREYCLFPDELKVLPKSVRRSAYHDELNEVKYLRSDVIDLAIKKYGSLEAMEKHRQQFILQQGTYRVQRLFDVLPPPSRYIRLSSTQSASTVAEDEKEASLVQSGRVVKIAIAINLANCALKFVGWSFTGSNSLFAEAIHSVADTSNQVLLYWGLRKSLRKPDSMHPYGYSNLRYVSSLISGASIFWVGTGLNCYHGIHALAFPEPLQPLLLGFCVLGVSFISEGVTLVMAYRQLMKKAKASNLGFWKYLKQGNDPSLNVVFLEDLAAVGGVAVAASFMACSHYIESVVPDAVGSIAIGSILSFVSYFIVRTNIDHLIGRSIPEAQRNSIVQSLESDPMIRSVSDVKATEMGNKQVRFKAEIEFDGRNITRAYMDDQNLDELLEDIRTVKDSDHLKAFLTQHGDQIIDRLATEIDRIEKDLKTKHPELRHVDLEAL